jgi:hypothetical protein
MSTPLSRLLHGAGATLACLGCIVPCLAHAEGGQFYGLLRSRDLTPFGFLRLDMRPAHAVTIEPGSWAIEAELGYQNTWALSPGVEKYLTSLESSGRRDIGPVELASIYGLPGENYLVDFESALLDLTFHYKLGKNWTAYAIASAVSYHGGFLDSTIEGFHDALGFSTFGRPAVIRNDIHLVYDLKSVQVALLAPPPEQGFMDPTFGLRYAGLPGMGGWQASVEAGIKVPLSGRRFLLSTGRVDAGLQASLQRSGERHAVQAALSMVYYAGSLDPSPQEAQVVPTIVLGYEYKLSPKTNLNLQSYVSRSVYSHDQTDLDELLGLKYQVSAGFRHQVSHFIVSFALTENLQNINNTPDVGFQLGLAYVPKPVPQ